MKALTKNLFPLILLIFILSSCTATVGRPPGTEPSFIEIAYKSLAVSKETYDLSMSTVNILIQTGRMTQKQADKILELAGLYMNLHNDAVSALLKLKSSGLEKDKTIYLTLIPNMAASLTKLIEFLDPISKQKETL